LPGAGKPHVAFMSRPQQSTLGVREFFVRIFVLERSE
jgi:hypothetical protein